MVACGENDPWTLIRFSYGGVGGTSTTTRTWGFYTETLPVLLPTRKTSGKK